MVTSYAAVGPAVIGTGAGPGGPVLRSLNRLLGRLQPGPREVESSVVTVYRLVGRRHDEVTLVDAPDFAQGRAVALDLVQQIESGAFLGDG